MELPIEKIRGPCIILAGAGTGKTYTIVEKIKYLIQNKIYDPEKIVCITFSNEAANNIIIRAGKFLENEPIIRTFHAFSADLLRKYGNKIGIDDKFKILTPDDAKIVLHRSLRLAPYYCHKYIEAIGTAKDLGIKIEELENYVNNKIAAFSFIDLEKRLESLQFELQTLHLRNNHENKWRILGEIKRINRVLDLKRFISAWKAYEKLKNKGNYQDYSDLNKNALELLKAHTEIGKDFDYIIVDEFQDTNKIQLELLIALQNENITIVGDMNQSIYRFRGAYRHNFNLFRNHFKVGKDEVFALDKSYRSPNKVLKAAHDLILNNYENKEECFLVENFHGREGDNIEIFELKNAKEEARKVSELVKREIENGKEPEEICIMFRTHQHGRIIRRALELNNIAYTSVSKNSLLKHASVRKAIHYLRILNKLVRKEKGGEDEWWNLIYELKFPGEDLMKIGKFIRENKDENISVKLFFSLENLPLSESGKMGAKILIERIKMLLPLASKNTIEIIPEVYRIAGLIREGKIKEDKEIMLNMNKFYDIAKEHTEMYSPDLTNFLNYLEVIENLGIEINGSELEEKGVRLMTLHATKGMEYKIVIITNMAQKRFPMERYLQGPIPLELYPELAEIRGLDTEEQDYYIREYEKKHQLMEERRLCYVAFTRAKEKLILTYASEYNGKKHFPSQFLQEIKYKDNKIIDFYEDNEEFFQDRLEVKPAISISFAINANDFDEALTNIIEKVKINEDENEIHFSPSALLLFSDCQKKYEYKYIYNMPDDKIVSWDAIRLGSFVHIVLEKGVKENWKELKNFLFYAQELHLNEDWESLDIKEAKHLIKVFFERNKTKYNEKSKTEQMLATKIHGLKFVGFADRIDFNPDGLEVIDYKTGKNQISPKYRDWQLGYYALAARELGNVRRITLDMLKHEKPLEFNLDEKGNAISINSNLKFNINEIEEELTKTANEIINAYKKGFKPCPIEKNCDFCNEYVYGL